MPPTPQESKTEKLKLLITDPWLGPYASAVEARNSRYLSAVDKLTKQQSLVDFCCSHEYFGFSRGERDGQPGVWYREWAPKADALFLTGDFNDWNRASHPLQREDFGVWSIFLPDSQYEETFIHGSKVKVHIHSGIGPRDRIPAYIRRAVADDHTKDFCGQYWQPDEKYDWLNDAPHDNVPLRIYEAHVGMAQEREKIGTYSEFTHHVLPRIASAGYNTVQLMAVQEHPYYGSFGYQVSNLYAPSSRFGTPEELKALIDTAHGYGLRVLLDLVHSHAVKNMNEGLSHFDGTDHQYFHAGGRGQHPAWDSLLYDYGKEEVLRFLLSNVRYWLEEFRFDGFRFDGVTSMIYLDHGLGRHFSSYDDYFPPHVDEDAITYLQLANTVAKSINADAITIAEEVSGMIGMAAPIEDGGIGFDYRLAMGVPDYWIKLLKERKDEEWNMGELYHTLVNRRRGEKHIAYAESHDQALVGDKTIAFWLMDADMYHHMHKTSQNIVVERGMAMHKMIRLITFAIAGEGYLNFMGNEFGHPEWIDFPREGNGFSCKYARRQWSLVDDHKLRFGALANFDRAMLRLESDFGLLDSSDYGLIQVHEERKLIAFWRNGLVFIFNFHPAHSFTDHRIGVPAQADYSLALDTDDTWFDGHGRLSKGQPYPWQDVPYDYCGQSIQIYAPARTAIVLKPTPTLK